MPTGVPLLVLFDVLETPPPHDAHSMMSSRIAASDAIVARSSRPCSRARRPCHKEAKTASATTAIHHASGHPSGPRFGGELCSPSGTNTDDAVVVTPTVTVCAFDPSSVTDAGETEHVASDGAPAQVSETV